MDFTEQSELSEHHSRKTSFFKRLIEEHPTALIIGSFIVLPFIIFGIVSLGLRIKNGSASNEVPVTPTPVVSISPIVSFVPTSKPVATDTPSKSKTTATPTKKPTPKLTTTVSPTTALSSTVSATPTKQANLYFQTIDCTYVPTASGSAAIKLDNVTFSGSSSVPATANCNVIFQNSEDVQTGEIWYTVYSDNDQMKKLDVGTLKKGNYPTSEYKQYTEVVSLKSSTGSHEVKFEVNHDKVFPESNYDDNFRSVKYTVQ